MNSVVNSLIEYIECEMKDYNNEIEDSLSLTTRIKFRVLKYEGGYE